jgi:hypothetical protein
VTRRRSKRRKQLLYNFKETRARCKFKDDARDYTVLRTRFGKVYGPVVT